MVRYTSLCPQLVSLKTVILTPARIGSDSPDSQRDEIVGLFGVGIELTTPARKA